MLFPVSGETKLSFKQHSPIHNQERLSRTSLLPSLSWLLSFPDLLLGCSFPGSPGLESCPCPHPAAVCPRPVSHGRSLKTQEWHEVQNCCRASSWTSVILVGPSQLRIFCGYVVSKCAQKQMKEYYSSLGYRPLTWASCACWRQCCFLLPAGWKLFSLMGTREAS